MASMTGISPRESRRGWAAPVIVLTALAALLIIAQLIFSGLERRALGDLPAAERRLLYERTHANLTGLCTAGYGPSLADFCRAEASVIVALPECDPACKALANPFLPHATR